MAEESSANGVEAFVHPIEEGQMNGDVDFKDYDKTSVLKAKIEALEEEKSAFVHEIEGMLISKKKMEQELENLRSQIDKSEHDKGALNAIASRAVELETEVFRLQHDFQSSMSECEDLKVELQNLTKEYETLKHSDQMKDLKIKDLIKEKSLVVEKEEKMEIQLQQLEAELKALVEDKEDVKRLNSSLEDKLYQSKEKLISYAEEKALLEKKILEMENESKKEDLPEGKTDEGWSSMSQTHIAVAVMGTLAAGAAIIYLKNSMRR